MDEKVALTREQVAAVACMTMRVVTEAFAARYGVSYAQGRKIMEPCLDFTQELVYACIGGPLTCDHNGLIDAVAEAGWMDGSKLPGVMQA